jgi:hypothetical protein
MLGGVFRGPAGVPCGDGDDLDSLKLCGRVVQALLDHAGGAQHADGVSHCFGTAARTVALAGRSPRRFPAR